MKKVGLLSDTHSYFDPKIKKYFAQVDEIWHAGDVGNVSVIEELEKMAPVRGVFGNIDGTPIRALFPEHNRFDCEGADVWITHIGGYPGRYDVRVRDIIRKNPPDIFITGHSHILKVKFDKKLNVLHLNPGAAGKVGFHQVKTLLRFEVSQGKAQNLEVIELGPKSGSSKSVK